MTLVCLIGYKRPIFEEILPDLLSDGLFCEANDLGVFLLGMQGRERAFDA